MKKAFLKFSMIFILCSIFTTLFAGCDIISEGDDNKYYYSPDVSKLAGDKVGVAVISKLRSADTDFIFIFRKEIPEDSSADPIIENIGIINQKSFVDEKGNLTNSTFLFQDQYVTADVQYSYLSVFHDSKTDIYHNSDWSKVIKPSTGLGPVKLDTSTLPTTIKYSDYPAFSLTLDKDISQVKISAPNNELTGYEPCIQIYNGDVTKYFPLLKGTTTSISLRDIVSDEYLGVPLTLQNFLCQKIEYVKDADNNDTDLIRYIYFTSPVPIDSNSIEFPTVVEGEEEVTLSEIKITSTAGVGLPIPHVAG